MKLNNIPIFLLLILFLHLIFIQRQLYAQEETLLNGDVASGYFGGPVLKITEVNNKISYMIGARGGWIVNKKYVFGLGGYGLISAVSAPIETRIEYNSPKLKMEYNLNFAFSSFLLSIYSVVISSR